MLETVEVGYEALSNANYILMYQNDATKSSNLHQPAHIDPRYVTRPPMIQVEAPTPLDIPWRLGQAENCPGRI